MTRKPQIKRCGGAVTTIFLVLIVAPKLFHRAGSERLFLAFERLSRCGQGQYTGTGGKGRRFNGHSNVYGSVVHPYSGTPTECFLVSTGNSDPGTFGNEQPSCRKADSPTTDQAIAIANNIVNVELRNCCTDSSWK